MSTLSPENIYHLGHLARLDLTEEEQVRYAEQLTSVVGYVEKLAAIPVETQTEGRGVTGMVNVLAADQPRSKDDLANASREDILAGAPLHTQEFFIVRAVL